MNTATWIAIFLPLFVILMQRKRRKRTWMAKYLTSKKKAERDTVMVELAKRMIGKECIIYIMDNQITGTVQEVNDSALLLINGTDTEVINLDFVMRIREYPKNKKGKKKAVVLD